MAGCSFCSMYREKQYSQRRPDAVLEDIRRAARSQPEARRFFLADGDALSLPTARLRVILGELATAFPKLSRVSCYATPANILNKSVEELVLLKERAEPTLSGYRIRFKSDTEKNHQGGESARHR